MGEPAKLTPIDSIPLKRETIRDVIFVNIAGGDKTILVFESGRILLMPVYRSCPVQFGSIQDIQDDLDSIIQGLAAQKAQNQTEYDKAIGQITGLRT